jgi:hypothetical protein
MCEKQAVSVFLHKITLIIRKNLLKIMKKEKTFDIHPWTSYNITYLFVNL